MPSTIVVLSVCHSELSEFSTTATLWGYDHEKVAHSSYISTCTYLHKEFSVKDFISIDYRFMGASPDGLVNCLCFGDSEGVLEIKVCYI